MKRSTGNVIAPFITLDPASGPLYRQIYAAYRSAILEGRLPPGRRIPSTRALAQELKISRLPVLNAYEQLLHEGYLEGRAGSGTYVASSIGDTIDIVKSQTEDVALLRAKAAPKPESPSLPNEHKDSGAFLVSLPALDQFPHRTWSRLVSRHARRMSLSSMIYGDPAGHLPLRQAIGDYLRRARAVDCDASQIIIVAGSQMALQICARMLLKPSDSFCVEDPGYPGARQALSATGATLRTVPVDTEGLDVQKLGKLRARVVYVTPSHQYPLGVSMNTARRLALLEWAHRNQAWIIEDDYDSEYRYASRPLGSLQGMDQASRVIYVGTFSKVLFPALRIGYAVVPPALVSAFIEHRRSIDLFSPTLYQLVLADFINEGHFVRHLRRMRAVYLKRRNVLVHALHAHGDVLAVANSDAGMHLTVWLAPGTDDTKIVRRAMEHGIHATALSSCYAGERPKSGLVLGFGGVCEERITAAAEILVQVVREGVNV